MGARGKKAQHHRYGTRSPAAMPMQDKRIQTPPMDRASPHDYHGVATSPSYTLPNVSPSKWRQPLDPAYKPLSDYWYTSAKSETGIDYGTISGVHPSYTTHSSMRDISPIRSLDNTSPQSSCRILKVDSYHSISPSVSRHHHRLPYGPSNPLHCDNYHHHISACNNVSMVKEKEGHSCVNDNGHSMHCSIIRGNKTNHQTDPHGYVKVYSQSLYDECDRRENCESNVTENTKGNGKNEIVNKLFFSNPTAEVLSRGLGEDRPTSFNLANQCDNSECYKGMLPTGMGHTAHIIANSVMSPGGCLTLSKSPIPRAPTPFRHRHTIDRRHEELEDLAEEWRMERRNIYKPTSPHISTLNKCEESVNKGLKRNSVISHNTNNIKISPNDNRDAVNSEKSLTTRHLISAPITNFNNNTDPNFHQMDHQSQFSAVKLPRKILPQYQHSERNYTAAISPVYDVSDAGNVRVARYGSRIPVVSPSRPLSLPAEPYSNFPGDGSTVYRHVTSDGHTMPRGGSVVLSPSGRCNPSAYDSYSKEDILLTIERNDNSLTLADVMMLQRRRKKTKEIEPECKHIVHNKMLSAANTTKDNNVTCIDGPFDSREIAVQTEAHLTEAGVTMIKEEDDYGGTGDVSIVLDGSQLPEEVDNEAMITEGNRRCYSSVPIISRKETTEKTLKETIHVYDTQAGRQSDSFRGVAQALERGSQMIYGAFEAVATTKEIHAENKTLTNTPSYAYHINVEGSTGDGYDSHVLTGVREEGGRVTGVSVKINEYTNRLLQTEENTPSRNLFSPLTEYSGRSISGLIPSTQTIHRYSTPIPAAGTVTKEDDEITIVGGISNCRECDPGTLTERVSRLLACARNSLKKERPSSIACVRRNEGGAVTKFDNTAREECLKDQMVNHLPRNNKDRDLASIDRGNSQVIDGEMEGCSPLATSLPMDSPHEESVTHFPLFTMCNEAGEEIHEEIKVETDTDDVIWEFPQLCAHRGDDKCIIGNVGSINSPDLINLTAHPLVDEQNHSIHIEPLMRNSLHIPLGALDPLCAAVSVSPERNRNPCETPRDTHTYDVHMARTADDSCRKQFHTPSDLLLSSVIRATATPDEIKVMHDHSSQEAVDTNGEQQHQGEQSGKSLKRDNNSSICDIDDSSIYEKYPTSTESVVTSMIEKSRTPVTDMALNTSTERVNYVISMLSPDDEAERISILNRRTIEEALMSSDSEDGAHGSIPAKGSRIDGSEYPSPIFVPDMWSAPHANDILRGTVSNSRSVDSTLMQLGSVQHPCAIESVVDDNRTDTEEVEGRGTLPPRSVPEMINVSNPYDNIFIPDDIPHIPITSLPNIPYKMPATRTAVGKEESTVSCEKANVISSVQQPNGDINTLRDSKRCEHDIASQRLIDISSFPSLNTNGYRSSIAHRPTATYCGPTSSRLDTPMISLGSTLNGGVDSNNTIVEYEDNQSFISSQSEGIHKSQRGVGKVNHVNVSNEVIDDNICSSIEGVRSSYNSSGKILCVGRFLRAEHEEGDMLCTSMEFSRHPRLPEDTDRNVHKQFHTQVTVACTGEINPVKSYNISEVGSSKRETNNDDKKNNINVNSNALCQSMCNSNYGSSVSPPPRTPNLSPAFDHHAGGAIKSTKIEVNTKLDEIDVFTSHTRNEGDTSIDEERAVKQVIRVGTSISPIPRHFQEDVSPVPNIAHTHPLLGYTSAPTVLFDCSLSVPESDDNHLLDGRDPQVKNDDEENHRNTTVVLASLIKSTIAKQRANPPPFSRKRSKSTTSTKPCTSAHQRHYGWRAGTSSSPPLPMETTIIPATTKEGDADCIPNNNRATTRQSISPRARFLSPTAASSLHTSVKFVSGNNVDSARSRSRSRQSIFRRRSEGPVDSLTSDQTHLMTKGQKRVRDEMHLPTYRRTKYASLSCSQSQAPNNKGAINHPENIISPSPVPPYTSSRKKNCNVIEMGASTFCFGRATASRAASRARCNRNKQDDDHSMDNHHSVSIAKPYRISQFHGPPHRPTPSIRIKQLSMPKTVHTPGRKKPSRKGQMRLATRDITPHADISPMMKSPISKRRLPVHQHILLNPGDRTPANSLTPPQYLKVCCNRFGLSNPTTTRGPSSPLKTPPFDDSMVKVYKERRSAFLELFNKGKNDLLASLKQYSDQLYAQQVKDKRQVGEEEKLYDNDKYHKSYLPFNLVLRSMQRHMQRALPLDKMTISHVQCVERMSTMVEDLHAMLVVDEADILKGPYNETDKKRKRLVGDKENITPVDGNDDDIRFDELASSTPSMLTHLFPPGLFQFNAGNGPFTKGDIHHPISAFSCIPRYHSDKEGSDSCRKRHRSEQPSVECVGCERSPCPPGHTYQGSSHLGECQHASQCYHNNGTGATVEESTMMINYMELFGRLKRIEE